MPEASWRCGIPGKKIGFIVLSHVIYDLRLPGNLQSGFFLAIVLFTEWIRWSSFTCMKLQGHFLISFFLISYAGLFAQKEPVDSSWTDLYESHADDEMPYRLMTPLGFDSKKRYPVIISLHGGGGTGADNRKQLKVWNQQLADKQRRSEFPCYVLAPQATELWGESHLKKIKSIIAALPSVDTDRIYMLGHSMGGHGTNILIQLDPHYFAAVAPSAGTGRKQDEDFIEASLIKDIPIWAFHGDQDNVCPIEPQRTLFSEMKALGGNMKLTTWAGDGHGVSGKFITGAENGSVQFSNERCDPEPDFMTWLFKQKRSDYRLFNKSNR